ncbi:phosphoribosylformylglycinamidine synthase [Kutzneria sp. 744]|nr:phosphoribosylformylglycinamidine synthase [Kutzneria sp. 744]
MTTTEHLIDTVEHAASTPEHAQPYRELGLKDDEYQRIRDILGRRPTDAELAMYSVMWSEHCSYKSSKIHLAYFGKTTTEEMRAKMLAGIGENAGVVDIGDGWAVTFKVESHNHPSYVEPYQGAATGVGGIVRDIMAMGARPIAVVDPLRFGPADAPDTRRVLHGVVAGVGGYGNCLGLPNIGGELVFDASYAGNPLLNAGCIGALRVEDLHLAHASGTGNKVILFGARTGLDGIGGVSVLASDSFSGDEGGAGRKKLPSVQVGDPFTEKVLIECCLELYREGIVVGIQDLGGAGLSCATSELASAGDGGMHVWLDRVPLRATGMTPAEVLSSESQERMMAVVKPSDVDAFMAVCRKWDVIATEVGEVTDGDRLVITWHDQVVVDVPPRTVAHEGPVYHRPIERPADQDALQANGPESLTRPQSAADLRALLLRMISSPNLASKRWVTEQYDRYVRGNTVLAQPADSGMVRVDEQTGRGVALSTDCNGRFCKLDPYQGAQGPGRGVPERGLDRRDAAGGHRLPELRLARGPGRDVAVRAGHQGPGRRLRAAGHPGHRRQRQLLQPDRQHGDPAHAGGRRARRDRRRRPAHPDRLRHGAGRDAAAARRHPRRVRRLRVGARRARPPRRPSAAGRPGAGAAAGRGAGRGFPRRHAVGGARPVRRRPGPGHRRVLPARRDRRADHPARGCRPVRAAVLRVGRPCRGRRAAQRGAPLHRDVHRAGAAVGAHRCGGQGVDRAGDPGPRDVPP